MIIPGGGLAPDGARWISCKPRIFLPVRVLSALFRRLMLEKLAAAHAKGQLRFLGKHQALADRTAFDAYLKPLYKTDFAVHAKEPFAGPSAVLAYLSRYTHRVAIANSRLIKADEEGVTFKWKDYRQSGRERFKTMTLQTGEFIRRFLLHVLPQGFHRIRHYGLLANGARVQAIAKIRDLLSEQPTVLARQSPDPVAANDVAYPCPCCGGRMIIVEIFEPGVMPRPPPTSRYRANGIRRS